MRFGVPRSASPSPTRRLPPRRRSGYGIPAAFSSSEDSDGVDSDGESSSSSNSFCYGSESEIPQPTPKPRKLTRSNDEVYYVEDTIASIRLRVKHRDEYEEWEHKTRKDAFITARNEQTQNKSKRLQSQTQMLNQSTARLSDIHSKQLREVETLLQKFKLTADGHARNLQHQFKQKESILREGVEKVIKVEEDKVKAIQEEERKRREALEKKRREEAEKKRLEEERKKQLEEKKRKEEEEKIKKKQQEEEEERKRLEEEKLKSEHLKAHEDERKRLGLTTPEEDWRKARESLRKLKSGPIKEVKGNKQLKTALNAARRAITAKIGQLTNDPATINRTTQFVSETLRPSPAHPPNLYFAILSAVAKCIIKQAETEVVAEKRSALPLAQATVILLWSLEGFSDIFWAKLCQRTGGWAIPYPLPSKDYDGSPMFTDDAGRRKAAGFADEDETLELYMKRQSAIMRVYFHVLYCPTPKPLDPVYRSTRYWGFFSRLLNDQRLLKSPLAADLMHTALEAEGPRAMEVWGSQWVKLLGVLYEAASHSPTDKGKDKEILVLGGTGPEDHAARIRVQLEIETILGA